MSKITFDCELTGVPSARYITLFRGLASPGLINAADTLAGDKVLSVLYLSTLVDTTLDSVVRHLFTLDSNFGGDRISSFDPVVPGDGQIAQTDTVDLSSAVFVALLSKG